MEFVADLSSDSLLLLKDPILLARARSFIHVVNSTLVRQYAASIVQGGALAGLLEAFEEMQALLPAADEGMFALGNEPTIADFAFLPFLAQGEVVLKNEYVQGSLSAYDELRGPRFARLWKYFSELKARAELRPEVRRGAFRNAAKVPSWLTASLSRDISRSRTKRGSQRPWTVLLED